jgi:hypothetical protein
MLIVTHSSFDGADAAHRTIEVRLQRAALRRR